MDSCCWFPLTITFILKCLVRGCFRGSLVQLASSGEILATCATRYHLSFVSCLSGIKVKSSQVKSMFCHCWQIGIIKPYGSVMFFLSLVFPSFCLAKIKFPTVFAQDLINSCSLWLRSFIVHASNAVSEASSIFVAHIKVLWPHDVFQFSCQWSIKWNHQIFRHFSSHSIACFSFPVSFLGLQCCEVFELFSSLVLLVQSQYGRFQAWVSLQSHKSWVTTSKWIASGSGSWVFWMSLRALYLTP